MFGTIKTFLYTQVYINIIVSLKTTTVYVEEVHFNGTSYNNEEVFDTSSQEEINTFIVQMTKKSPLHYISILDTSIEQGATPTCSSKDMAQYCDMGAVHHVCYSKQWGYYTSRLNVLEYQKKYLHLGLDFIFSPFFLLVNFFKDKVSEELALYILVQSDFISLSIFNKSELLFAQQIDMDNQNEFHDELLVDEQDQEEELSLDDVNIDLEDVDVMEDMDTLDDFDNIEDLDTFDEMDEFGDDEEEIGDVSSPDTSLDDENGFGEDYHRFSLIQSAIKLFYNEDKFTSDFVQKVYIADSIGMGNTLKKFLEEEMFLAVFVRRMDLSVELCEAAKAERK